MDYNSEEQDKNLLDYLKEKTDCLYLSNLFYAVPFHAISAALEKLAAEEYDLEDWNQTIQYFLRSEVSFTSAEEARIFLIQYGKNKILPPAELTKQ